MQLSSFHHLPPLFFLLLLVLALLVAVLQIGILGYAYEKMGISRRAAFAILFFSLIGAYVNIPVAEIPGKQELVGLQPVQNDRGQTQLALIYDRLPGTVLAVNVGGALIPTLLSIYLMVKHQIYAPSGVGVSIVGAVMYWLAKPVAEGISVPIFVPPILAAIVAMVMSRQHAAPLAYISGCLGTLVGADLMHLHDMGKLGASFASIGGAGTFDGVFLTGILAVLLALGPARPRPVTSTPEYLARQKTLEQRRQYD